MASETRSPADDRSSIDRRVEAIDAALLEGPVRSVLGDPSARVVEWRHEPVGYDFLNPSSGGVYRFEGTATGTGRAVPWRLVLKVTRSAAGLADESPLPPGLAAVRDEAVRWDRELRAYESGFLAALDGDLVAAACHGGGREDDDTGWLWLEDLGGAAEVWSLGDWERVGRALGAFNGRFLAGRVPDHDWLGRRWLRVWSTQLTPYHFGRQLPGGAAWDAPLAREAYPVALQDRLARLWGGRDALLRAVEALPQTCCHLDAHRRNLFLRAAGGATQVVAIDWGLVGLAPAGEEIASTLVGTVASGELPARDAAGLASVLYDAYLGGLREAGWAGDERDVRLAFAAAAGLRAFSILRLDVAEGAASAEAAAVLADAATLAGLLVELGDEARALCAGR
ncbi:MAG TPA: hypothetical protein VLB86_07820 [Gaiellaceae bacterium]|nr:hypothetical protein [Gaiellaceae bacterium]